MIEQKIDEKQYVIDTVKRYLEPHQPRDYRLTVSETGIKQDNDFWYVVVHPTRDDVRSYDYYGHLAEAENDIADREHLKVLLLPVLPG